MALLHPPPYSQPCPYFSLWLKPYLKSWLRPHRGQSIVEITLVLPILLIMGLAIAEMGRLWQTYHAAKLAAEDGAYTATIYNNEGNKGETAIDARLSQAKLLAQTKSISAISSNGGVILGYSANVTVNFTPFFPGLSLDVPGAGPIKLFETSIPIHYESVYSRKVM